MLSKPGVRVGGRRVRPASSAVVIVMTTLLAFAPCQFIARAADTVADAASAAPAAPKEKTGKLQHLGPAEAASILGRPVRGPKGQEIGRVVDVLVDQAGHPRAAVIDFGGFMGVGSRKVAVAWHLLRFAPDKKDKPITLQLTQDQIKAAPEFKPDKTPTVVTAPPGQPIPAAVPPIRAIPALRKAEHPTPVPKPEPGHAAAPKSQGKR